MQPETLALGPDALCERYADFVPAQERAPLFAALRAEIPFAGREIHIFGRPVLQPRLVAWIGDPDAVYTYSRTRHEPLPWTPTLAALRGRVAELTGEPFNAVLCNLYRDGRDSMGMHADAEPELGPRPVIASLSLGATRLFQLRHRRGAAHGRFDIPLTDGSLLVMRGATQDEFRHGIPKEPAVDAPRINLTFRRIVPRSEG